MFKRISVLVRRPQDDRGAFSQGWMRHGAFVSRLSDIRHYLQNHVIEDFGAPDDTPFIRADGFVELWFDSREAMDRAFGGEAVKAVRTDEPNFLGHATGYALTEPSPVRTAEDGSKLIVAVRAQGHPESVEALTRTLESETGCDEVIRDDVAALIVRQDVGWEPQPVDLFLHALFSSATAASAAGRHLERNIPEGVEAGIYRVRTMTLI